MIPKTVYQTWETKNIPEPIKQVIENMKQLNRDYNFELHDADDRISFLKQEFGLNSDVVQAYNMLNVGAAKADLWRYAILYKKGGVYLDLDSEICGNLDQLIDSKNTAIISRERHPGNFVQWCLMFDKNHPILENVINKCVVNIKNKITNDILFLTGPQVFSDGVRDVLCKLDLNRVELHKTEDSHIASLIKLNDENLINTRFYSTDYRGYCKFQHAHKNSMYNNVPHWKNQKNVFI